MKKLLIVVSLILTSNVSFANNPTHGVFINGKEIDMEDTYKSLVKKLGKDSYMNWEVAGLDIHASTNEYGLSSLSVTSLKPTKHRVEVYKSKFTFNESLRSVANKLKPGCFDIIRGKGGATYSFISNTGAEGEISVVVSSTINGNPTVQQLLNARVDSVAFSYDALEPNGTCVE